MAHDEELAERVRAALGGRGSGERRMFGGLSFLVEGHMAVAVSGEGGLMVRVDPAEAPELLRQPGVEHVQMGSRGPMAGWVRVDADALADDAVLDAWVRRGVASASALPPKG